MSVEKRMLDILEAIPGFPGRVFHGYAPQDSDEIETQLPLTILQRASSEWLTTMCGTDPSLCFASVVVTYVARDADACREMADSGRLALCLSDEVPTLETENSDYDADLRAWAVTQSYRVFDDRPNV